MKLAKPGIGRIARKMEQPLQVFGKGSIRILTSALLLSAFSAVMSGGTATFALTGDPGQEYLGVKLGPYPVPLTGTSITDFFCLDSNMTATWGSIYSGTTSQPFGQSQDEAEFLTAYLLSKVGLSSSPSFVDEYEGPTSSAIWRITDTMGNIPPGSNGMQYVTLPQNVSATELLTSAYLSTFQVLSPNYDTLQRFRAETVPDFTSSG